MSKWFEVRVTKTTILAVEVEDNETGDDATKYAIEEVGDFDEAEASNQIIGDVEIDRLRRHADEVLDLETSK